MNKELTYEERVRWFVNNYYETGMEYDSMLESMKNEDLDNFVWYGEKIQIPKFYKIPKQEISDEEIEKAGENYGWRIKTNTFSDPVKANELAESAKQDFMEGIKWYREQLKK